MPHRTLTRILHVDDEPDIREIVRLALGLIGRYTVESCASGQQAIDRAADFCPDILLLDMMMPGMSGHETLAAIRALNAGVDAPAVFMTAKAEACEIAGFRNLGVVDVIAKPFDPLTVSDQLSQIWARHAAH